MKIALRAENKLFVCAEGGGDQTGDALTASRSHIQSWETFEEEALPNGKVALKTSSGHYVCAELDKFNVSTDRNSPGAWEEFEWVGDYLVTHHKTFLTVAENGSIKQTEGLGQRFNRIPLGFLRVDGRNFVTEDGKPWQFRGYSSHYLLNCTIGGYPCDNLDDVLDQIVDYGYNTVITIGLHASPWKVANGWALTPINHPEYFVKLVEMFDRCAAKGLRVAHAVWADAQYMPSSFNKQAFWNQSCDVMKGRWNVLARKGNESLHNGWNENDYNYPDMGGVLYSQGSKGAEENPHVPYLHFCEFEVKRKLPKMFLDLPLRQMMDGDFAGPATNRPTINIEPMYFADTNPDHVGDKRSTDPRVALESGIMMAACAGGGFGCSLGLECRVLSEDSISDKCAKEFIRGLKAGFVRPLAALDFQGQK